MSELFADFKFEIGDKVFHRGRVAGSNVEAGIVVGRYVYEQHDFEGRSYYDRIYRLIGYGVDADAAEMEIEAAER